MPNVTVELLLLFVTLTSSTGIISLLNNYESAYGLHSSNLYPAFLTGLSNAAGTTKTFTSPERQHGQNLFLMYIGESATDKSRYLGSILSASKEAETLIFKQKSMDEQVDLAASVLKKSMKKIVTPLSEVDIKKCLSIEQRISYAQILQTLEKQSVFICAPEGDPVLNDFHFFKPEQQNSENANLKYIGIDLFDSAEVIRSTYNGKILIENKQLTMLVGSTGALWQYILMYLAEHQSADGFRTKECAQSLLSLRSSMSLFSD